jgi:peroxiredoxin (alkyl hydroperoxide reductase subunit C)
MAVLVGKKAPNFDTMAVVSGKEFKKVSLEQYKGRHVVLFFYPLDFTFVCPTEIIAFEKKREAFEKLGVEVIGCSVDSHFTHKAWIDTPLNKGGIEGVQYTLLSDLGGHIARDYDVMSPGNVAYRGLFLIDKEGIVRHQIVNDLPLGRNVDETLRMVEALQHVEAHGEVCPANWNKQENAMQATNEGVSDYLAQKYA